MASDIKLFNMDCMEALREMEDNQFDLAVLPRKWRAFLFGGIMTVKGYIIDKLVQVIRIQKIYPERALCGSTALFAMGLLPVYEHALVPSDGDKSHWVTVNEKKLVADPWMYPQDIDMTCKSTPDYRAVIRLCGSNRYPFDPVAYTHCVKMDYPVAHDLLVVTEASGFADFHDFHGILMQDPSITQAMKKLFGRGKDREHAEMDHNLLPRPSGDLVKEAFEREVLAF